MKLICVDNIYYTVDNKRIILPITIGKEYNVYSDGPPDYYILTDDNGSCFFSYTKRYFITKEEYRNSRLEDIGI